MIIETNGIEVPDYLNKEFFQAALKNGLNESDIEIEHLNFTMGSAGGDNYCSFIYRVEVTFMTSKCDRSKLFLIAKSMPVDGDRQVFQEMQVYEKETEIYFKLLPELEKLLKIGVSAKCYHAVPTPIQTIVFEDLKQSGHRLADREQGLDEQHCAVLLRKLGKFHAASMSLADKKSSVTKEFSSGLFNKETVKLPFMEIMFLESFKCTTKMVAQWPGYERIAKKLLALQDDFLKRIGENSEPSPNELKVLNHGDLWVNNFLFKYNNDFSNYPTDVTFIDFQGSYYASPGIDINYFLNTSVQQDLLENRRDFMLKEYYYKSLRTTLENLEYRNIPSFDDILDEVQNKEYYGFFSAVGILALICMDRDSSKDNCIEAYACKDTADQKRMIACSTKRYQNMMRYILKRGDRMGLFD